jgi:hypothetical protein
MMGKEEEPYEPAMIIIDAGSDDTVYLRGPLATPQEVAKVIEDLRVQRARRLKAASPEVKAVFDRWAKGSDPMYFLRRVEKGYQGNVMPFAVYCRAPALKEALNAEIQLGASLDEVGQFTGMSMAGLVYGTYFSQIEPDGEPGSAHICDLEEITEAEFERARKLGWPLAAPRG